VNMKSVFTGIEPGHVCEDVHPSVDLGESDRPAHGIAFRRDKDRNSRIGRYGTGHLGFRRLFGPGCLRRVVRGLWIAGRSRYQYEYEEGSEKARHNEQSGLRSGFVFSPIRIPVVPL